MVLAPRKVRTGLQPKPLCIKNHPLFLPRLSSIDFPPIPIALYSLCKVLPHRKGGGLQTLVCCFLHSWCAFPKKSHQPHTFQPGSPTHKALACGRGAQRGSLAHRVCLFSARVLGPGGSWFNDSGRNPIRTFLGARPIEHNGTYSRVDMRRTALSALAGGVS